MSIFLQAKYGLKNRHFTRNLENFIRFVDGILIVYFSIFGYFFPEVFEEYSHSPMTAGSHSYSLEMNQFGDLLHYEFVSAMNGFRGNRSAGARGVSAQPPVTSHPPPLHVDWRLRGAVTPVKTQVRNNGARHLLTFTHSYESSFLYFLYFFK